MRCAHCDTENVTGVKFCGECGTRLPANLGAPGPSGGLPNPVLAEGERRLVTVLFADLSGFTSLAETLDPEALRDLITACFNRLVPCITGFGGTIDKFVGDEVMALFGAPQAHENDAERALRAALEMRAALAGFNRERGLSLALHSGVNSGLVFAGNVGGGGHERYSVMGDAVNVAARLKALGGCREKPLQG